MQILCCDKTSHDCKLDHDRASYSLGIDSSLVVKAFGMEKGDCAVSDGGWEGGKCGGSDSVDEGGRCGEGSEICEGGEYNCGEKAAMAAGAAASATRTVQVRTAKASRK
jgi:hypothetical protein